MRIILSVTVAAALFVLAFYLGMHWDACYIKHKLQQDGFVIRQYGDTAKVKITGTAEEWRE